MELLKSEIKKILFYGLTFSIEIKNFTKIRIHKNTVDVFLENSNDFVTFNKSRIKIV